MAVQTLAVLTLALHPFLACAPSWQEVACFLAVVAYGLILYSITIRYLNPNTGGKSTTTTHAHSAYTGRYAVCHRSSCVNAARPARNRA
jgi:hypothetical protein